MGLLDLIERTRLRSPRERQILALTITLIIGLLIVGGWIFFKLYKTTDSQTVPIDSSEFVDTESLRTLSEEFGKFVETAKTGFDEAFGNFKNIQDQVSSSTDATSSVSIATSSLQSTSR